MLVLTMARLVLTYGIVSETPPKPVSMRVAADLLGNGRTCRVILDARSPQPVSIRDGARRVVIPIKRRWRPWKIAAADVDGDGRQEIAIALFKATAYMPKLHNCLFVYRYDGREAYPRWQGSTLGRPFTDFAFVASPGGDRLVTLDIWLDGRRGLTAHRWSGFGFRKERSVGNWRRARLAGVENGRVLVDADGKRMEWRGEDVHEGVPGGNGNGGRGFRGVGSGADTGSAGGEALLGRTWLP